MAGAGMLSAPASCATTSGTRSALPFASASKRSSASFDSIRLSFISRARKPASAGVALATAAFSAAAIFGVSLHASGW